MLMPIHGAHLLADYIGYVDISSVLYGGYPETELMTT